MNLLAFLCILIETSWAQPQASSNSVNEVIANDHSHYIALVKNYMSSSDLQKGNRHADFVYEKLINYRKDCTNCTTFVRDPKLDFIAYYTSRKEYPIDDIELSKLDNLLNLTFKALVYKCNFRLPVTKNQTTFDYGDEYKQSWMYRIARSKFFPHMGVGGFNETFYVVFSDPKGSEKFQTIRNQ